MSRSYKRTPILKDRRSGAVGKKFANRKVRRYKHKIPNGSSYKKIYCSYDIHDYVFRETYKDAKELLETMTKHYINGVINFDPREDKYYSYNHWAKYYLRK